MDLTADTESDESTNREDLLKKLEEYGDSLLEETPKTNSQKKRKKIHEKDNSSWENYNKKKKKKKKQNKLKVTETAKGSCVLLPSENDSKKLKGKQKYLFDLKQEVDNIVTNVSENKNSCIVVKDGAAAKSGCQKLGDKAKIDLSHSVVVFSCKSQKSTDLRTHNPKGQNFENSEAQPLESLESFQLEKARNEVLWLGIDSLARKDKRNATEMQLIKRGAKPRKNEAFNYKLYQNIKKKQEKQQKKEKEMERLIGNKKKSGKKDVKRKRDKNDVRGFVDNQMGYYKAGVLYVKRDRQRK